METQNVWELLAEVRGFRTWVQSWANHEAAESAESLLQRIEAALTARDAKAEWTLEGNGKRRREKYETSRYQLSVYEHRPKNAPVEWLWEAALVGGNVLHGKAATLEEAKAAAMKATEEL